MPSDSRWSFSERHLILMLALALFAAFYLNLHAVPLFDLDEGAFSEATREMLLNGDYISTYLDGNPRYDKPILIYWLQAASVNLLGVNEFAFRLPSAIAGTLWVLVVFAFTSKIADRRYGLMAAIVVATSFEVAVMARAATADALLNLFIVCSLFCIYLYWLERSRKWLLLCFASIGFGFLTKGPVAVLIPLCVSLLFYIWQGEFKVWLKAVFNPTGILIFLAIAAPWYIAQYMKEGDAFIQGFFFKHNIDRFQSPMEKHGGNLVYYIPVILLAVLPYTGPLLNRLIRFKTTISSDYGRFALLWIGFVFIFFTVSGTKLPHYMLYGLTGMLAAIAMMPSEANGRWVFTAPMLWFLLLLTLPDIVSMAIPHIQDDFARDMLSDAGSVFGLGYRIFFIAAIAFSIYCLIDKRLGTMDKLIINGLVSVLGLALFVIPAVGEIKQGSLKQASQIIVEEGLEPVRWRLNTPSVSVYTQRIMTSRKPEPGETVLTKSKFTDQLGDHEVIFNQGGVVLARVLKASTDDTTKSD